MGKCAKLRCLCAGIWDYLKVRKKWWVPIVVIVIFMLVLVAVTGKLSEPSFVYVLI